MAAVWLEVSCPFYSRRIALRCHVFVHRVPVLRTRVVLLCSTVMMVVFSVPESDLFLPLGRATR
jgi:hypothetical protein